MTSPRQVAAYEDALRTIAAAAVRCRSRVSGFHIPTDAAQTLLADVEHALASLIALGAVPTVHEVDLGSVIVPATEQPDGSLRLGLPPGDPRP